MAQAESPYWANPMTPDKYNHQLEIPVSTWTATDMGSQHVRVVLWAMPSRAMEVDTAVPVSPEVGL